MKDNFSSQSNLYAKYRPTYPNELYNFILANCSNFNSAWDCGTGNGQVAGVLAEYFQEVKATDISEQQLKNAIAKQNILYSRQAAEKTNFKNDSFDLITVAQAIHWFNFEEFYKEVERCLKPEGIFAVIGYELFSSNEETNRVIDELYRDLLGPYWDKERYLLEEGYKTIPFPFKEIETPKISLDLNWSFDDLIGYLKTWSAVKHYENDKGVNPVDILSKELRQAYGERGVIHYPILFRLGKLS
ncbi:class I SAM-dependent methyltransferase [Gillisia sp. Hel_I_29]|uniref:class I SAM-dependent methyltransferase n=1 Tax=Gillisia sp. Hel_I_29 TaxID=1249975 RepID=UPI000556A751|nr:class I SAM-dependent methyltransferase [Gillisia sp. Hel_I_29]